MPRVTPNLFVKRRQIVVGAFQNLGEATLVEGQGAGQACLRVACSRRRQIRRIWTSMSCREPFRRLRL